MTDDNTPAESPLAKRMQSLPAIDPIEDVTKYAAPAKERTMKIGRWTIPNAVSVAATTFLGAVIANLRGNPLTVFSDAKSAEAAIVGAALFGAAAVIHLYQTSPPDRAADDAARVQP